MERHAEFYIYDGGSFLSEIGGYLGLFLGYALISMVDFVENIWNSICKPQKSVQPEEEEHYDIGTPIRIRRRSRRSSIHTTGSGSIHASMMSMSLNPSIARSQIWSGW